MKTFKINKGWYRSAGNVHRWRKHGYHVFGIGLNMLKLKGEDKVQVIVNETKYLLDVDELRAFHKRFPAVETKRGVNLVIFSKDLLTQI